MPKALRTSAVYIATRDRIRVFRSIEEVPPRLRKTLIKATSGLKAVTILIADRRTAEKLARAARPAEADTRPRPTAKRRLWLLVYSLAAALSAAAGLAVWWLTPGK